MSDDEKPSIDSADLIITLRERHSLFALADPATCAHVWEPHLHEIGKAYCPECGSFAEWSKDPGLTHAHASTGYPEISSSMPSIADLQRLSEQSRWDEDDVTAVAAALPALLEIAAAALALREQERKAERAACAAAAAPLAQINPDWAAVGVENDRLRQCQIAYSTALAKVRP